MMCPINANHKKKKVIVYVKNTIKAKLNLKQ